MKYAVLAVGTHGMGRIVLFPGRFNAQSTGGRGMPVMFSRKVAEWASSQSASASIQVCHVSFGSVDSTIPDLDRAWGVSVFRADPEFVSELANIEGFGCIVLSGYANNASPLIKDNLVAYVAAGGGLVLSDINLTGQGVDFLGAILPVQVEFSDFSQAQGNVVWTDSGKTSPLFDDSFVWFEMPVVNTIPESGLGTGWDMLAEFDTEQLTRPSDDLVSQDVFLPSSDYLVKGAYFVGYYSTVYQNGITTLKRNG